MPNTKTHPDHLPWQTSLRAHADQLEQHANVARVLAMAETPLDGIAVAWDLVMMAAHCENAREARTRGENTPAPPPPVSRLLTRFADAVRDKLVTVGSLLREVERERLVAIAPQVLSSIEAQDQGVVETIAGLLSLSPDWTALWLRGHLDEIEARFAS